MELIGILAVGKGYISITAQPGTTSDNLGSWQLNVEYLADYWPQLRPFIVRWLATNPGFNRLDDIRDAIAQGKFQLFVIHDSGEIKLVFLTQFVQYAEIKLLRFMGFVGQNPLSMSHFWCMLENWAQQNGAVGIETLATPKTVALAKRFGAKPVATLMRKMFHTIH